MKKACIFLVSGFLLLFATGCSYMQKDIRASGGPDGTKHAGRASRNPDSKSVRAEGKSDFGVLSIVPSGSETIERLDAPSVYGEAGDYSIRGDYKVIFKDKKGREAVIAELDDLQIIQPQDTVMEIQKLTVDDADIFYFIPQYQGSNDIPVKFFGVTKDGNAFEFKIENNKAEEAGDIKALSEWAVELSTNSGNYAPPAAENGNILMRTVYSIGGGQDYEIYNVVFHADMEERVLRYISKEVYDSAEKALSRYVSSLDERDWEAYMQYCPGEEAVGTKAFLTDPENIENSVGILGVRSAKIKEIMALPDAMGRSLTRVDEYKKLYEELSAFLVGIDYRVDIESKYIYNGVNYCLILLGREEGKWKVIENSSAPVEFLKQSGYSFGSADEAAAIKIIEARIRGLELNTDGKVLGCNGSKEIFLPGITPGAGAGTAEEASGAILQAFLEHFRTGNCLDKEKIKAYRPGETGITQKETDGWFVFSAEFSVQPDSGPGGWFIGNGRPAEDGWTYYKLYFFTHREEDNGFKVVSWSAYR